MNDDQISRKAAIELCDWYEHEFCECDYVIKALADDLKSLPGVDVCDGQYDNYYCEQCAEPRKGNWIGIDDEPCEVWECDKCGHIVECDATLALPNYCENCGVRMEESDG